jgi:4-hydroxy-4-methyl-2-oxoglutarate aldolase
MAQGPAALEPYDSCLVSDALEACGMVGAVPGIRRIWPSGRVVGRAVTVRLRRLAPGESPPEGPHLGARAIEASTPGDVIVVAHEGRTDSAGWGGLLCAAAAAAGVSAAVVDGACRDVDDAVAMGFPVFARAATPLTARGRTVEAATGVPVQIGGIPVHPGDVVVADGTGVVVVPQDRLDEVAARAADLARREAAMLAALRRGVPPAQVLGGDYDRMLRTNGSTPATVQD